MTTRFFKQTVGIGKGFSGVEPARALKPGGRRGWWKSWIQDGIIPPGVCVLFALPGGVSL